MSDININNPNKKLIFSKVKSQNEITKDQKISTKDSDENIPRKSILKKNLSHLGILSNFQNIIKKNKTESIQALSRRKKQKIIQLIKYDLNELNNKRDDINLKLNTEKHKSLNIFNNLNKEIKEKGKKILKLSEEQKELIEKLKIIKKEIDNRIEKANVLIYKKNEDNKQEKILEQLIKVKEKEIELVIKNNTKIQKENKRILKIFNNNDFSKEINLRKQLLELEKNISELENDIRKLQSISEQHQDCDKHKNELLNNLTLLTNAYQFEIKKASLKDIILNSDNEDKTNNLKLETINNNKSFPIFFSPK